MPQLCGVEQAACGLGTFPARRLLLFVGPDRGPCFLFGHELYWLKLGASSAKGYQMLCVVFKQIGVCGACCG